MIAEVDVEGVLTTEDCETWRDIHRIRIFHLRAEHTLKDVAVLADVEGEETGVGDHRVDQIDDAGAFTGDPASAIGIGAHVLYFKRAAAIEPRPPERCSSGIEQVDAAMMCARRNGITIDPHVAVCFHIIAAIGGGGLVGVRPWREALQPLIRHMEPLRDRVRVELGCPVGGVAAERVVGRAGHAIDGEGIDRLAAQENVAIRIATDLAHLAGNIACLHHFLAVGSVELERAAHLAGDGSAEPDVVRWINNERHQFRSESGRFPIDTPEHFAGGREFDDEHGLLVFLAAAVAGVSTINQDGIDAVAAYDDVALAIDIEAAGDHPIIGIGIGDRACPFHFAGFAVLYDEDNVLVKESAGQCVRSEDRFVAVVADAHRAIVGADACGRSAFKIGRTALKGLCPFALCLREVRYAKEKDEGEKTCFHCWS